MNVTYTVSLVLWKIFFRGIKRAGYAMISALEDENCGTINYNKQMFLSDKSQAWIYTSFNRFTKIGQIFYN